VQALCEIGVDFPRFRRHSEGTFLGIFESLWIRAAEVDSVYVFYSGRDHHVTHVRLKRLFDHQRGET
jgi:hypothetical protein